MTNEELVAQYQSGNMEAFDDLLANNEGIVYSMVNKWFNKIGMGITTFKDLEAECILGFFNAVRTYNPDKGAAFSSYAFDKIHWHLCRTFKLNMPKTDTGEPITFCSIDDLVPGTENLTVGDTIADDCDIEEEVTAKVTCETEYPRIWDAVNELECQCRDVIYKRYKENKTLDHIASDLLLSGERIRQLEDKALKILRQMQKVKDLAETFDYECSTAYHYGVQRFKNTRISSTEAVAFKHIKLEEKLQLLEDELNKILL